MLSGVQQLQGKWNYFNVKWEFSVKAHNINNFVIRISIFYFFFGMDFMLNKFPHTILSFSLFIYIFGCFSHTLPARIITFCDCERLFATLHERLRLLVSCRDNLELLWCGQWHIFHPKQRKFNECEKGIML